LSALIESQATHPAPPVPHALFVGGVVQVAPEQHPAVQLVAVQPLQIPPLQVPAPHDWQLAPPLPHIVSLVPVSQVLPEQQPVHDVESHAHAPPAQCWPAAQGAPLPHWQAPLAEQMSAVSGLQVRQTVPAVPQVARSGSLHVVPVQQPPGQDVASQTQAPARQCWPGPQAAEVPHRHSPAVQLSALVALQAMQVAPAVPQLVVDGVWQVEPVQQPPAHDIASQTQAPTTQCWPLPQVGPLPHEQAPEALQLSALLSSHATQAAPLAPHAIVPGTLQVAPEQQPLAHAPAQLLQTPPLQVSTPGQVSQAPPAVPHELVALPARHEVPLQQPRHETGSHMQTPPTQCWPGTHGTSLPHRQTPSAEQLSVRTRSQETQVAPPAPHVVNDRVSHRLPLQQPLGHDVASQTQLPAAQRWPGPQAGAPPQRQVPLLQASALLGSHAWH